MKYVFCLIGFICTLILLYNIYRLLKRFCHVHTTSTLLRDQGIQFQRQLMNEANSNDPSLQFQSQQLDSSILHSLSTSQFKGKDEEELDQSNTDCAVCLGEFEEGEWLKHLPNCTHAFHVSCIDTWFQSHSTCPLCRSHVFDLTIRVECSISTSSLLETLQREDFFRERAADYQILRPEILQNSSLRWDI